MTKNLKNHHKNNSKSTDSQYKVLYDKSVPED